MIRTILFYIGVVLSLIVSLIAPIKIKYLSLRKKYSERTMLIHKTSYIWARFIMKISGAKVKVNGLDNIPKDETVLFVSNHQSDFDIPLLMSIINVPKGFIAKKELETVPIVSLWMKYIRCIFMDRSNLRKSAQAIVEGVNILKEGHSMVIFPEGTRSKGGPHGEFKAGSFKLATKAKVNIVPITIDGSYKLYEANNGRIVPSNVTVTIHPSVDVPSLTKEQEINLHEDLEKIIFSSIE